MAYFPFFMDVSAGDGLIVGGGRVALRKIRKLLDFGARLTVCAPSILPEIEAIPGLVLLRRPFEPSLLEGKLFVISAANDNSLNCQISTLCREQGIPVNVVDDRENCTFLFPALVKRGALSVGISTGGASPSAAVYWKNRISSLIPQDAGDILDYLDGLRETVKEAIPGQEERAAVFSALFGACMESGRPLSAQALARILDPPEGAPPARKAPGTVYLVGAGCGQAGLITVRGLKLLQGCDTIVYDDLIAPELLDAAPERAQRLYMGKRADRHSASQAEISARLVELARAGKTVVRLKGGDPFVFGRGGEEALALQAAGIPFEVVPGVASPIAIPELAGIPVTHRGLSQSFHVVTAHTAGTGDGLPAYFDDLARLPGTLVFLMGLSRLEVIARRLTEAGKPPDTPAAVLSGGNAPHPAAVRGTLADIAEKARAAGVQPPAVILVGDVAALELASHNTEEEDQ